MKYTQARLSADLQCVWLYPKLLENSLFLWLSFVSEHHKNIAFQFDLLSLSGESRNLPRTTMFVKLGENFLPFPVS